MEMKILLLGSGALKIGQAGEFDYSGSQAIKTFKSAGHEVILVNPNIATVQTDPINFSSKNTAADKVYLLPVTPEFVKKIIIKDRPDALALSFGGQTALNCGLELEKSGFLAENNIKVLGTSVKVIESTEDREIFVQKLTEININTPRSIATRTLDEAVIASEKIGFPLIMRAGFTLGGQGSGFCETRENFVKMATEAFSFSKQLLIEEDLRGWKEIEYEVVRDNADNCITVVNMENFDPLGVHTGESIVIAPSLTLNNAEYQMLRTVAIKTIRHLGIVGECNIQYTLNPNDPTEYRVIEVNARLSRSSALASKASGYPLASVAASIMLGKDLPDIQNAITKTTTAFFEPALDYIALKIPRWDLQKFRKVSHEINTEMKSVGEIMSLGRNFPEALQKGLRMLSIGSDGLLDSPYKFRDKAEIKSLIIKASPQRVFAIAQALWQKIWTLEEVWENTKIDRWFLAEIKRIVDFAHLMEEQKTAILSNKKLLRQAKILGFSDIEIARLIGSKEMEVRQQRISLQIIPVNKRVDTLAGEVPTETNYLYTTYLGEENDV